MSAGGDHRGNGGPNDPESRMGGWKPARRRMITLAVGVIVVIFTVLLVVWLLGRSAADAQGPAGAGSAVLHHTEAGPAAGGTAGTPVEPVRAAVTPRG
ncbi:hypothetical protein E9549_01390 [Blastococcus sp. MG754426]|uniref:hypothetical protein n=1 Tax=unclassified Blastococcus TaxID=2619396 RepID=UPI001EF10953|nr:MULTISPECIES: hypothetical protein [unclassified Blastococcus]MCF6506071.1 hypothetical protein [Blastococcus sp. MG754426]MCF6510543.1 hypothetical protein [Blastococcus sp. MG754427]MCF6735640.1 hypothetical protein [Blastococcus sp. KM273129]